MPTSRGGRQVYQNLAWCLRSCRVHSCLNFCILFLFLEMRPKVGLGVLGEDKTVAQVQVPIYIR